MRASKKFRVPPNPLEVEATSLVAGPSDQWLDSQIMILAQKMAANGTDAERTAAGMIISQVKQKQFSSEVGKQFLHGFHQFLLGRLPTQMAKRSLYGTAPLYDDPEVRAYLEAFIKAKQRFRINLAQLDMNTPKGINQWFLYYKYRIMESTEYLSDFEIFERAFNDHKDQEFFDPQHPWMPRPYNSPMDSTPAPAAAALAGDGRGGGGGGGGGPKKPPDNDDGPPPRPFFDMDDFFDRFQRAMPAPPPVAQPKTGDDTTTPPPPPPAPDMRPVLAAHAESMQQLQDAHLQQMKESHQAFLAALQQHQPPPPPPGGAAVAATAESQQTHLEHLRELRETHEVFLQKLSQFNPPTAPPVAAAPAESRLQVLAPERTESFSTPAAKPAVLQPQLTGGFATPPAPPGGAAVAATAESRLPMLIPQRTESFSTPAATLTPERTESFSTPAAKPVVLQPQRTGGFAAPPGGAAIAAPAESRLPVLTAQRTESFSAPAATPSRPLNDPVVQAAFANQSAAHAQALAAKEQEAAELRQRAQYFEQQAQIQQVWKEEQQQPREAAVIQHATSVVAEAKHNEDTARQAVQITQAELEAMRLEVQRQSQRADALLAATLAPQPEAPPAVFEPRGFSTAPNPFIATGAAPPVQNAPAPAVAPAKVAVNPRRADPFQTAEQPPVPSERPAVDPFQVAPEPRRTKTRAKEKEEEAPRQRSSSRERKPVQRFNPDEEGTLAQVLADRRRKAANARQRERRAQRQDAAPEPEPEQAPPPAEEQPAAEAEAEKRKQGEPEVVKEKKKSKVAPEAARNVEKTVQVELANLDANDNVLSPEYRQRIREHVVKNHKGNAQDATRAAFARAKEALESARAYAKQHNLPEGQFNELAHERVMAAIGNDPEMEAPTHNPEETTTSKRKSKKK